MIFREYDNKKSREESRISKLYTNMPQGLLIISDKISNIKLTYSVCFVWVGGLAKRVEK